MTVASLLVSAIAAVGSLGLAHAFPQGGAPVCLYADTTSAQMTNVHGTGMAAAATMKVTPMGAAYQVSLTGITSYNGLILWVRDAAGTQHVGAFDMAGLANVGLRGKDCTAMSGASSGANSTLGHFMANAKTQLSFTWTPDAAVTPGMQLVAEAVVVGAKKTQWSNSNPAMFIAGTPAAAGNGAAAAGNAAAAAPTSSAAATGGNAAAATTKAKATATTKDQAVATTAAAAVPTAAAGGAAAAPSIGATMTLPGGGMCVVLATNAPAAATPVVQADPVAAAAATTPAAANVAAAATTKAKKAKKTKATKKNKRAVPTQAVSV
ncbi:hypothetical protein M427DRAFT_69290 [Gonapodya prolifera JEL478]|uniref:Reelin domain-containing protein n=1 Tax=Gonapodya prolifera (strain JEL478) TaxID=1344416 RepID=A0A139AIW5_GONPJ|nr:hypothetical protein M427DRAFT_69290 [Gonapodya prolifera JEL478]|eukprot:KXS16335.1 hypothetical protein M427DRAFT_69290 [Gonapodya prolifera JEL478]